MCPNLHSPPSHPHYRQCRNDKKMKQDGSITPIAIGYQGIPLHADSSSPYQRIPSANSDGSVFTSLTSTLSSSSSSDSYRTHHVSYPTYSDATPNDLPEDLSLVNPLKVSTAVEMEHVNQYFDRYLSEDYTQENQATPIFAEDPPQNDTGVKRDEEECMELCGVRSPHVARGNIGNKGNGSDDHFAYFDKLSDTYAVTEKASVSSSQQQSLLSPPPPSLLSSPAHSSSSLQCSSSSSPSSKRRPSKHHLSARVVSQSEEAMIVQSPLDQVFSDPDHNAALLEAAELLVEVSANAYALSPQGKEAVSNQDQVATSEADKTEDAELCKDSATVVSSSDKGTESVSLDSSEPNHEVQISPHMMKSPDLLEVEVMTRVASPNEDSASVSPSDQLNSDLKTEDGDDVEEAEVLMVEKEVEVTAEAGSLDQEVLSPEYVDQVCSKHKTTAQGSAGWTNEEEESLADVVSLSDHKSLGCKCTEVRPSAQSELPSTSPLLSLPSLQSPRTQPASTSNEGHSEHLSARPGSNLSTQSDSVSSLQITRISDNNRELHHTEEDNGKNGSSKGGMLITSLCKDGGPLSLEEASDSGISSSGTKQSTMCSSGDNSPCETTSPAAALSPQHTTLTAATIDNKKKMTPFKSQPHFNKSEEPLTRSDMHFSYPTSPQLGKVTSSPQGASPEDLMEPILEPFPSLANSAEYMVLSPDLSPPKPPEFIKEVDLQPKVDIYQVNDSEGVGLIVGEWMVTAWCVCE